MILILVVGVVWIGLVYIELMTKISKMFIKLVKEIKLFPFYTKFLGFVGILVSYQLFFLPMQTGFIILMGYILNDYISSMIFLFSSTLISGSITYIACNGCLRDYMLIRYRDNDIFQVILQESVKHPNRTNAMIRFMFIPVTLKNIALSLGGGGYFIFTFWNFVSTLTFGSLYIFIGAELNIHKHTKKLNWGSFKESGIAEQLEIVLFPVIFIATISIMCFFCILTRRKLRKFRAMKLTIH